jgi:hypothetical protein
MNVADSRYLGDHRRREVVMAHSSETVYHPGPRILVTSGRIETAGGRFSIRHLDEFRCVYDYPHPARKIALICAGIELGVAVPLAAVADSVPVLWAGLVVAAGLGAATWAHSRNNPTWMMLTAEHRGVPVTLFSSQDQQEFEQVRRAVMRAVEADDRARLVTDGLLTVGAARPGRLATSRARRLPYGRRSADPA